MKPFFSDRVTFNFTPSWDNWGGAIKQSDVPAYMKLREGNNYNMPCSSLSAMTVLWDGTIRACGCRFVKTDHDDLVIGRLGDDPKALLSGAERLADSF